MEVKMNNNNEMDLIKAVSMASRIFDVVEGDKSPTKSIEQRAKFYKMIEGIDFPNDWDDLTLEEKRRRLDKLDKLGLSGGGS